MTKLRLLLIAVLLVTGCVQPKPPQNNLANWRCTPEQIEQVDREFQVCDQSSYFSDHCYLTAKKSICTYIGVKS